MPTLFTAERIIRQLSNVLGVVSVQRELLVP